MDATSKRLKSFIVGGLCAGVLAAIGLAVFIKSHNASTLIFCLIAALCSFTFSSCLILGNNFVGEVFIDITEWGFVEMPGLIFTLDLDGILWLITVKLLFWILGFVLAVLCAILAFIISAVLSVFAYPFAIYRNIKHPERA